MMRAGVRVMTCPTCHGTGAVASESHLAVGARVEWDNCNRVDWGTVERVDSDGTVFVRAESYEGRPRKVPVQIIFVPQDAETLLRPRQEPGKP